MGSAEAGENLTIWPAGSADQADVPIADEDPNIIPEILTMLNPFTPGGPTATLAVTGTTGRVAITRGFSEQVMVTVVAGSQIAFVKFGDNTVVATTADTPVLPGTYRIFSVPADATNIAAITSTSTATLYATPGNGQ